MFFCDLCLRVRKKWYRAYESNEALWTETERYDKGEHMTGDDDKNSLWNKNAGRERTETQREAGGKRFVRPGISRATLREGISAALAILTVIAMLVVVHLYFVYIN